MSEVPLQATAHSLRDRMVERANDTEQLFEDMGTSSSCSLTSNLLKSDLLTTHRSPSTENRAPLQTS